MSAILIALVTVLGLVIAGATQRRRVGPPVIGNRIVVRGNSDAIEDFLGAKGDANE